MRQGNGESDRPGYPMEPVWQLLTDVSGKKRVSNLNGSGSRASQAVTDRANDEMQSLLDRYLDGRQPVSLDNYDWPAIRPHHVDPEVLNALEFVTLIESNPREPASVLLAAADRGNAPWLRRFIEQTWLPEELMHSPPYREYLVRSGTCDAATIDSAIADVRERKFTLGVDYTPIEAATYGWLQELLTWRYYETIASFLVGKAQPGAPVDSVLLKILNDIAKEENFHRFIYLSGVRTSLKYAPEAKEQVIRAVADFMMPGHQMVPHLQAYTSSWAKSFGFPVKKVLREISSEMIQLVGHNGLGQATIRYGATHDVPWFLKVAVLGVLPPTGLYRSPVNYLAGRLVTKLA